MRLNFDEFVSTTGMIVSDDELKQLGIEPEGEEGALNATHENLLTLMHLIHSKPEYHIITSVESDDGNSVLYDNCIRTVNRIQYFLGKGNSNSELHSFVGEFD
jgi:hypothetical protein